MTNDETKKKWQLARQLQRLLFGREAPQTKIPELPNAKCLTNIVRKFVEVQTPLSDSLIRKQNQVYAQLCNMRNRLTKALEALEARPQPQGETRPERMCFNTVDSLLKTFSKVEVNCDMSCLEITTPSVALAPRDANGQSQEQMIELGQFKIQIFADDWGTKNLQHIKAIALQPHPALGRPSCTHPHVDQQTICFGSAKAAAELCLKQRQPLGLMRLVWRVLSTYNPVSPFYYLEQWDGVKCPHCGRNFPRLDSCPNCREKTCPECLEYCVKCGKCLCITCNSQTRMIHCEHDYQGATCSNLVCQGHHTTCHYCGKNLCPKHACSVNHQPCCQQCMEEQRAEALRIKMVELKAAWQKRLAEGLASLVIPDGVEVREVSPDLVARLQAETERLAGRSPESEPQSETADEEPEEEPDEEEEEPEEELDEEDEELEIRTFRNRGEESERNFWRNCQIASEQGNAAQTATGQWRYRCQDGVIRQTLNHPGEVYHLVAATR